MCGTMTGMDDIATFLAARIDEDEAVAKVATPGPWQVGEGGEVETVKLYGNPGYMRPLLVTCDSEGLSPAVDEENAAHIARHDPARVLAEVAAKRAIVEFWSLAFQKPADFPHVDFDRVRSAGRWTVWKLAAVYDTHPDYRPEWRP